MDDRGSSDGDSDGERYRDRTLPRDPCYRCRKRVYPVEKVDVGVLFHRRCFRCRVCGLQLTLRTFHWDQENEADVYCNVHVPKLVGTIDQDALGIKSALNAPKKGNTNEQIRGSLYNPGWQYDANAMEFTHAREIFERDKHKKSIGTYEDFEKLGVFIAQSQLEQRQKLEEDRLYEQFQEERERRIRRMEEELQMEKEKTVRELVSGFEKMFANRQNTDLEKETERIESHYRQKKKERLKLLLQRLTVDEKARVARLIEKHSQEMLLMIAEKFTATEQLSSDSEDMSPTVDFSRPPTIAPPEFRRSQLFKSPDVFEKIDDQVYDVAKEDYSTFTSLVKDLTVHCVTDLEKARAIFRWITMKDLNALEIDDRVSPESPLGLLRGIKCGTESYHDLFKRLCSYAGLHCEVIEGYSKGAGYKPGLRLEGHRFRNSWTAVGIDGSWCFVNCNWGARHVKGQVKKQNGDLTKFYYKCDEFYFITDPEDHIYQHFPDDPKWQLLECSITLAEFINLPVVKSPFFNYGLRFVMHYDCTQYTSTGMVVITLKIPNLLGFGYTLEAKDGQSTPKKLEGRVMLRIIGHKAIFTVAPPKPGKYFFFIYAKDDWSSESVQSACGFKIKCRERRDMIRSPFPKVSFFGPTPSMSQYGLVPQTHIDPLVTCNNDDVTLQFQLQNDVKVSQTFAYYGPQSNHCDFQRYVFVRHQDSRSMSFLVRCPMSGKYVFSLYGTKVTSPDDNTVPCECLFRYLLECKQPSKDIRPLPRVCHRWYNATLLEPLLGDLEMDKKVTFRVQTPVAADVAMLVGEAWYHFKEIADSIWEGSVMTGKTQGKAKLYAKLNKDRSRFSPLLEFEIK